MATIAIEGCGKSRDGIRPGKPYSTTVSSATTPRLLRLTVSGVTRDFEHVGTDASGNKLYRDQNRRPMR